jgi:hypothetical protein
MNPRHLLAMTDAQMAMLTMAASPLPQAIRPKFLQAIAYQLPVHDRGFVDAITVALAALGYSEDGSKLITKTTNKEENDYDHVSNRRARG